MNTPQTAVITGAAMGIGRAAGLRFAGDGANVCLLDVLMDELEETAAAIAAVHPKGERGIYFGRLDVSDTAAFSIHADAILAQFGAPDLLMNNAVTRDGRGFDAGIDAWRRAMDVNFFGVVNGVQAFLPSMLKSGRRSYIVNTGSKQGITNPPGHPIYNCAKSALKTYTEALQHDLRSSAGTRVSAHLLVPGWTTTGKSEHKEGAWLPEQVIDRMIEAVSRDDFYIICPDGEVTEAMDRKRIAWGAADITENRPPLSRWHADWKAVAEEACKNDPVDSQ